MRRAARLRRAGHATLAVVAVVGMGAASAAMGCGGGGYGAAPPPPAAPAVGPRPAAPLPAFGTGTRLRVGIVVDRDSTDVGASGEARLEDVRGYWLPVAAGGFWRIRAGAGPRGLLLTGPDGDTVAAEAPLTLRSAATGSSAAEAEVLIAGRRYRGEAVIARGTAGITVINAVALEDYLRSVVALELGFRAPSDQEAVKAQAVAARTYAVRYVGRREALGFDVFPTDADQVYGGRASEIPEVDAAVLATAGEILTWEGRPIEALFHSTCGWSTEPAEQVWLNRAPVPYLQAVSDRSGDGPDDYYCRISPRFRWREEWDAGTLTGVLARSLPAVVGASAGNLGRVQDVRVARTSPTGRAAELVIATTTGTWSVPSYRIREVLRPASGGMLLSTLFQLYVEQQDGALSRLVAAGAGYGHGVGMCQFGAVGRARAGQGYRDILAAYYQGTRLERMY